MYDVYLGGVSISSWREEFKDQIGDDITVFDPMIKDYDDLDRPEQVNQSAKELTYMQEKCNLVVFYLDLLWKGTSLLLDIGDCVGRGKQVIICLQGDVENKDKIERYCDFHGVLVVHSLEDLVIATEECLAEVELCNIEGDV